MGLGHEDRPTAAAGLGGWQGGPKEGGERAEGKKGELGYGELPVTLCWLEGEREGDWASYGQL